MKSARLFAATLTACCTIASISTLAQTTVPREQIPGDIPADVRKDIEALYLSGLIDRGNATMRLGKMGERAAPAIPFLIGLLHDTKTDAVTTTSGLTLLVIQAQMASDALAAIGKPAIRPLGEALHSDNGTVASFAARALSLMHDPEAVKTLMGALETSDADGRETLATRLKESKDFRVVEPLLASLAADDPKVRGDAVATLEAVSGEKLGVDSQPWIDWWQKDYAKVLQRVEGLIPELRSKNAAIRGMVAGTLEELTGERFGQDVAKWQQWLVRKKSTTVAHPVTTTSPETKK